MEMGVELHFLAALLLGKNSGTFCTGASVGSRASMNGFGEDKILCHLMNSNRGPSSL